MQMMHLLLSRALCQLLGVFLLASVRSGAAAGATAGTCIGSVSDGLQACVAGGGITFVRGNRAIVTSSMLVAAGRRIALKEAAARADHKTLTLVVKDPVPVGTPGHAEFSRASYSVSVTIAADGRYFEVAVDASATASEPPPPTPPPPSTCTDAPINVGMNPNGGDLCHHRQPHDSADPALCREACCNAADCDVWALMRTGMPGLGTPCVAGKPCCYLKNSAVHPAVSDPNAIASGGQSAARGSSALLHNLELELVFSPPHATGEDGVFKWLPNLHRGLCVDASQQGTSCWYGNDTSTLTAEHFFRSPAVIGAHSGDAFAIVPDLDLLAAQQRAQPPCGNRCTDFDPDGALIPQALDLHAGVRQRGGNAPPLGSLPMTASYGLSSSHRAQHEYSKRDNVSGINLRAQRIGPLFRASLFLWAGGATPAAVVTNVNSFLWRSYGRGYLHDDIRPQIMPYDDYPRRFSYNEVLFDPTISSPPKKGMTCAKAVHATVGGHEVWGIANMGRDGANFHAWENDACNAFGIAHYGKKWANSTLARVSTGMLQLSVLAPTAGDAGPFPSIYNFITSSWEGTIPFANPAGAGRTPTEGWKKFNHTLAFDNAAMGVTVWWQQYHLQHLAAALSPQLADAVRAKIEKYGRFVQHVMLPNGAVPGFFNHDLSVFDCGARSEEGGCVSATSAISGAVLAKLALTNASFAPAALLVGEFALRTIIPTLAFYDFETFFSCNHKPVTWTDTLNGMKPINTLSVGWTADLMLALYTLTKNTTYLEQGELVLGVLNLFQQVWSPPRYEQRYGYLFGGLGAGNTDGEWSDREHRAVPTLADYFDATGKIEYLERAVAATRASFGLMHMPPNFEFNITRQPAGIGPPAGRDEVGYSPENILHGGEWDGFSGFNWGGGGAATAAAYLELRFGGALVSVVAGVVSGVGVDGVRVEKAVLSGTTLTVTVANELAKYGTPDQGRALRVTVRCKACGVVAVVLNGKMHSGQTSATLMAGLVTTV